MFWIDRIVFECCCDVSAALSNLNLVSIFKGKGKVVTYWLIDSAKRRSSVLKQPRGLPHNGNTVPLIDYLAPGLKGSTPNLSVKRTDSSRRSAKTGQSPNMLRKWHRFDEDAPHHDGYIHHSDSPRLHGADGLHHHLLNRDSDHRGSKELHGIHGLHALNYLRDQHDLSSDDQETCQDGPAALPLLNFEKNSDPYKYTSV